MSGFYYFREYPTPDMKVFQSLDDSRDVKYKTENIENANNISLPGNNLVKVSSDDQNKLISKYD